MIVGGILACFGAYFFDLLLAMIVNFFRYNNSGKRKLQKSFPDNKIFFFSFFNRNGTFAIDIFYLGFYEKVFVKMKS